MTREGFHRISGPEKPRELVMNPSGLTATQRKILCMIAMSGTAKTIAYELNISPKTVEYHRSRIMEATNVKDIAGLTRLAIHWGLVTAEWNVGLQNPTGMEEIRT